MGGVADGVSDGLSASPRGRRAHTPSSAATSCDYGILPFGLARSGCLRCQNRITAGRRTRPLGYIATADSSGILYSGRKISVDTPVVRATRRVHGVLAGLLGLRPGLVLISDDASWRRHVTFALWTRRRPRPSGKKVLYTPHPGLRARVRRARRVRPVRINPSGPGAVPPTPHQEWQPSNNEHLRGKTKWQRRLSILAATARTGTLPSRAAGQRPGVLRPGVRAAPRRQDGRAGHRAGP